MCFFLFPSILSSHNRKTTQWEHPLRAGTGSRFPGHPLQNHHASITPALPYNAPHQFTHQLHQAQTPTHTLGGPTAGWDQMGTSTPPGELAQQHYSPHQHRQSLVGGQPGPHQYSSSHSGSIGSPGTPGSMVGGQAGPGYNLHQRQQSMPHILSSPSHPQAHWEQMRRTNERGKLLGDPYLTAEHIRQSSQDSGVVTNLSTYGHEYAMADEMDSPVGAGGGGHGTSFGQQSHLPQQRRNMEIIDHLPGANVDTGITGMETDIQPSIDPSMMVGDLENYSQWV